MASFNLNLGDNIPSGFRLDRVVDTVDSELDTMYQNHCQSPTFRIFVSDSCLISLQITEKKTKLRLAIFYLGKKYGANFGRTLT